MTKKLVRMFAGLLVAAAVGCGGDEVVEEQDAVVAEEEAQVESRTPDKGVHAIWCGGIGRFDCQSLGGTWGYQQCGNYLCGACNFKGKAKCPAGYEW